MKTGTIIRLTVIIVAFANQVLVTLGYAALPWDGDAVGEAVSMAFTAAAMIWGWWKNNSVTKPAITADKILESIKCGVTTAEDITNALAITPCSESFVSPDDLLSPSEYEGTEGFKEM